MTKTTTPWRTVGPEELALIKQTGMKAFPPRLPGQPIFYPVTTETYAIKIARDWNVKASGAGFVTVFEGDNEYLSQYTVQEAGGRDHLEYWIPAEDVPNFNAAIRGQISVTKEFT
ncbi:MAG: ADP-ribosylation/crystallin J1 [Pikeienuella sp.]